MSVDEEIGAAGKELLQGDQGEVRPTVRCPSVPSLTASQDDPVTTQQGDHPLLFPQPKKQRRPDPKNPKYGIPSHQWPDVVRRVEQGETLRQVGKDYNVSCKTIRRVLKAARKQEEGNR